MAKQGSWLPFCAMFHHCEHSALVEGGEVIIYNAIGRRQIGTTPGMVYMYEDAFMLPAPIQIDNGTMRPAKRYEIQITEL